jgi:N-acetylneuraminic acid mutarotase
VKKLAYTLALIFVYLFSMLTMAVKATPTKENEWESMAPLPETRGGIRAAAVNGKIYVMSGLRNFEYDPAINEWTSKTPMPTPRYWFAITVYQNKIYTLGGRLGWTQEDGTVDSNANEVYDPATDTWQILSSIPTNISDINANVVNGKIYMIGGVNHQFPSLSINEMYDVVRDEWTNRTTMPYPVSSYASAVVDNRIYIMGGFGLGSNQTQIYDPQTDSWSLGTPALTSVFHAAAGATTGIMAPKRIYVVGGTTGEGGMFAVGTTLNQVYDPKNDSWTLGEPMPTARLALTVAVLNDQIYAIAGNSQMVFSPYLNTNQRYTPFGYGTPDPTYDDIAPEITLKSPKNETYYSSSVNLQFSVNEQVTWISYKLDNVTIDISGDTTISGLSLGTHLLTLYAIDNSGNLGTSETVYFTVEEPFPILLVATASSVAIVGVFAVFLLIRKHKHWTLY